MKKRTIFNVVVSLIIFISFLAYFSANWYIEKYGNVGFDAILFTLFSDLGGVEEGLVSSYLTHVTKGTLLSLPPVLLILLFNSKNSVVLKIKKLTLKIYPFGKICATVLSLLLCSALIMSAAKTSGADIWLESVFHQTKIFEEEYTDPKNTNISFPKEKRNLIYILMESMETTFFSQNEGGALSENHIPELYDLAKSNINFSPTDSVGGIYQLNGGSWTSGAIITQTSGVPLKILINDGNTQDFSVMLTGAYTINDVLKENGYYQSFLCGSDADFGGRKSYFLQHGVDEIFDYTTAPDDDIIPSDYFDNWWGMEDAKLYDYAKQRLLIDSKKDKPFALFMLTVDTHHIGGNVCDLCEDNNQEQYLNVYNCASKQLDNFINWIKMQDFYDDTTIVIVGDHCSMDSGFMTRNIDTEKYIRQIYNCFINSATEPKSTINRSATQLDMFPSTLAALGCKIEGDTLGLGVNLFSNRETLAEKYSYAHLNAELSKKSIFYENKLLLPKK